MNRPATASLRRRTFGLAGLAALLFGVPVSAGAEEVAVATTQQVGPNSHVLTDLAAGADVTIGSAAVNAGFVVTASSVVMVGAPGSAEAAVRWLEAIRAVTAKPVSHLLLTGYQPAQAEGIAALKARGAAIVARRVAPTPAQTRPVAEVAEAVPVEPTAVATSAAAPLVADLWLEDSTDLLFGGVHLQALAIAPVHGPHDMAYSVEEDAVLYAGELLVTGRLPDVREANSPSWIDALAELQKLGAAVAVPANGLLSRNPQADLEGLHDYLKFLRSAMSEAARQRTPFDEAYAQGNWSQFSELPMFDMLNRANARHTYLQLQGAPE